MDMDMDINRSKLAIVSLFLISCALVLLTSSIAISGKESRTALVIGNGAYKSSPLSNPVNDANDMAAALKKLGFSVRLKINADQRSMERSIREFGKDLRSGSIGLFYFAGHGLQVHGRNYLIPIGADVGSEADIKYEAVDAGRVLSQMYEAENGLNIIILDACRDNPYARSFRSSEKGLAKMDAPTGSILAYATAPGSVAADGVSRNGLYTSKLLKHMMTPGLTIERVLKNVRIEVMKDSGMRQVPWESSSLTGDFYFNTKRGIAVFQPPINANFDAERKRLEQERKELERIKAEIEERKRIDAERNRIEAEKKKLFEKDIPKYASISPKVTARDGNFIAYPDGVVYDKNTGLEWYAGPDKKINWDEAKRWVESLSVAGGDWRMPTREELKTLYKKGAGTRNMTALLKTTGWRVWSESRSSSSAWYFGFSSDRKYFGSRNYSKNGLRGFAVRSRRQ
jgi:hypothetical protein